MTIMDTGFISFHPFGEEWEDVMDYPPDIVACHICLKTEMVKRGRIPAHYHNEEVYFPGIEKRHIVNYIINCQRGPSWTWTFWQLCQSCHDQGWQSPAEALWGFLLYSNTITKGYLAV